jgi:hypothetical protein
MQFPSLNIFPFCFEANFIHMLAWLDYWRKCATIYIHRWIQEVVVNIGSAVKFQKLTKCIMELWRKAKLGSNLLENLWKSYGDMWKIAFENIWKIYRKSIDCFYEFSYVLVQSWCISSIIQTSTLKLLFCKEQSNFIFSGITPR